MTGIEGGHMAKLNLKMIISMALLVIGGALNMMLSLDIGLNGPGFILLLLSLVSFSAVYAVWKLKPEAWVGGIALYIIFILFALPTAAYYHLAFDIVVIVFTFFIRDIYGIKFRKELLAEGESELVPVTQMKADEIAKLSKTVGIDVKSIKCPRCNSVEVVISKDASGLCTACRYGIMDVKKIAQVA